MRTTDVYIYIYIYIYISVKPWILQHCVYSGLMDTKQ